MRGELTVSNVGVDQGFMVYEPPTVDWIRVSCK